MLLIWAKNVAEIAWLTPRAGGVSGSPVVVVGTHNAFCIMKNGYKKQVICFKICFKNVAKCYRFSGVYNLQSTIYQ